MTFVFLADDRFPTADAADRAARQNTVATRIAFLIMGLGPASWAPLIPYAKARIGLDEATLGLLLLCSGLGSLFILPYAAALTSRLGCRRVITTGALSLCGVLVGLAAAPNIVILGLALLSFGVILGIVNVAINVHAVMVEAESGRTLMPGFHAFYSLGGILGSGGSVLLLSAGMAPVPATLCVVALICLLLAAFADGLLRDGGERPKRNLALPHGIVLGIGLLCLVAFIAEGAMLDWSAVFLSSSRRLDSTYSGAGYALFAMAMTCGRLCGDRLIGRFGARSVLLTSSLCAAFGFIVAASVPSWSADLAGFVLVGGGAANIVPILYSAAGRQKIMAPNQAIAAIGMVGCLGILMGPAAVGFVAHIVSLPVAFAGIAATLLLIAGTSRIAATAETG